AGTVPSAQPLLAPLYGGKSAHELRAAMSDRPERSAHDIVREVWSGSGSSRTQSAPPAKEEFDASWRRWLHDGVVPNTAFEAAQVQVVSGFGPTVERAPTTLAADGIEINFRNDPSVLDGRFANNGWLQELPKPITKLTWDNAVLVSPATAAKLRAAGAPAFQGGEHGQILADVVELTAGGRTIRGALFTVVGHPDDCVTVHLGYGRSRGGRVATGAGLNE